MRVHLPPGLAAALPGRLSLLTGVIMALTLLAGCAGLGGQREPGAAAAANQTNVWSPRMEAKRLALVSATSDSGVAVLRSKNNELQANVPSDFSFDTDSALLKPRMKVVLDHFAADLDQADFARMLIRVVGHTDSRGPEAANDALSLTRGKAVARYLEGKGIAPTRIRVEGHGEHEPLIGNNIALARALNRRVEMFLSEPAN